MAHRHLRRFSRIDPDCVAAHLVDNPQEGAVALMGTRVLAILVAVCAVVLSVEQPEALLIAVVAGLVVGYLQRGSLRPPALLPSRSKAAAH